MLRAQQGPGTASGRKVRENQMVSMSKLVVMGLLAVLTAAVPIGVMSYLRRRGGRWRDFLVGAGTFFLFAMVLESLVHQVVLTGPLGSAIQGNIWIFGLYSGLMAGLFEEAGRFTAFKLVLRRRREPVTALSYGIGHGGCEAFLILGITYISNIVISLMMQRGVQMSAEITAGIQSLAALPVTLFLLAGFERIVAMTLHTALSVLVFAAVRDGRHGLFPLAILLHALADFFAVVVIRQAGTLASEAVAAAFALLAGLLAVRVYRNLRQNAENT